MYKDFFVFTEAFNCGKILSVCLESFHRYHDIKVHIIGTTKDFKDAGDIINHKNNILINWDENTDARNGWYAGHMGTALAFASCLDGSINRDLPVIHFDADCYFKGECLSEIIDKLNEGYDIIGTPRAYKNNLSGMRGLENTPDCISTYLMGVNTKKVPQVSLEILTRMCGGWHKLTNHTILDFFDPITHYILEEGGKIYFLDIEKYGGMSLLGSKYNGFDSNLNFDCGSHIAHFGGIGSGKSYADSLSSPPDGYAKWALNRWNFYSHIFFGTDNSSYEKTVYSSQNDHYGKRWCNGPADLDIIMKAKKDLDI